MKPVLNCQCAKCGHRWRDHPGHWAKLTKPQFHGDTTNGCPNCGHLYWSEAA
jgi:hypothetical protein